MYHGICTRDLDLVQPAVSDLLQLQRPPTACSDWMNDLHRPRLICTLVVPPCDNEDSIRPPSVAAAQVNFPFAELSPPPLSISIDWLSIPSSIDWFWNRNYESMDGLVGCWLIIGLFVG